MHDADFVHKSSHSVHCVAANCSRAMINPQGPDMQNLQKTGQSRQIYRPL